MIDRKLKRRLSALSVPQYRMESLENTINKARKIQFHPENQRMTTMQFFWDQFRFIRKGFWGMKLSFAALFFYLVLSESTEPESWLWTFAAISGPVLCLANANVLCDVFWPGMLELQMTAKHSLQKILIFRLMVSGVVDFVVFLCGTAVMLLWKGVYLWQIILYAGVPYNLMCLGCLAILNRKTEENALSYCLAWGIGIVFVMTLLKAGGYQIFEIKNVATWMALGFFTVLGVIREMHKLLGSSACKVSYGNF